MQTLTHPTICIVGSGAVGGYYGARLAQHGLDVHFLLRGDFDAVSKNGWVIKSCDGDFVLAPGSFGAASDPSELPKADLVLVTLKTTANDQFEHLIRPMLKDETIILTLQNGLGNEEALAALFGRERILGGMAFTCINRIGPGVIHHIAQGWIRLGEFGGGPSPRATQIAELFNSGKIDCAVLEDLRRGRWEKLCWNIPFNGLGAVLDWTTDRLIGTPAGEAMIESIIEEVVDAARALGVKLSDGIARKQIDKTRVMGAYQSSMQFDRRERRTMEVEAILGEPLRQGISSGAMMPRVQMIYEMAKLLDEALD